MWKIPQAFILPTIKVVDIVQWAIMKSNLNKPFFVITGTDQELTSSEIKLLFFLAVMNCAAHRTAQ